MKWLKKFFFKSEQAEAVIQQEIISSIRNMMSGDPDKTTKDMRAWVRARCAVISYKQHNLHTVVILDRTQDQPMITWMETDGEITNFDRKGHTIDDIMLIMLS